MEFRTDAPLQELTDMVNGEFSNLVAEHFPGSEFPPARKVRCTHTHLIKPHHHHQTYRSLLTPQTSILTLSVRNALEYIVFFMNLERRLEEG
jgi:hypothetical protein